MLKRAHVIAHWGIRTKWDTAACPQHSCNKRDRTPAEWAGLSPGARCWGLGVAGFGNWLQLPGVGERTFPLLSIYAARHGHVIGGCC